MNLALKYYILFSINGERLVVLRKCQQLKVGLELQKVEKPCFKHNYNTPIVEENPYRHPPPLHRPSAPPLYDNKSTHVTYIMLGYFVSTQRACRQSVTLNLYTPPLQKVWQRPCMQLARASRS